MILNHFVNTFNQQAKADKGKLQISLVPMQIVKDIAEVRMYGTAKYKDPQNWKRVELDRYIDALLRHTLEFIENPHSTDEESGIEHYKHMACNMAFICEILKKN
ncbi:MAG: dATP/dGTP diphosphohydrolase domain-containing protein [Anaerotignaceae bacterium]